MGKSSKKSKETGATDPAPNHQNGERAKRALVKAPRPKSTNLKPSPKPRPSSPRKEKASRKSRASAAGRGGGGISDDEIRMRAYFISEDRMREGRPGTSADDWLQARRQLEKEAEERRLA